MIIGWRAWYVGSGNFPVIEYNSNEHVWATLPEDGMLAVRTYEDELKPNGDNKGIKLSGMDYYFTAFGPQDLFVGADIDRREVDVANEIKERYTNAVVKRGMWTDSNTMEMAFRAMQEAKRWP